MWLTVYPCYWSYLFWFPFNKASTSHSHSAFQSKQRIVSFIIGFLVKNTTTCCLPSQLHVQIIAFKKCKEFLAIDGKKTSNCLLTKSNALSVSSVWYVISLLCDSWLTCFGFLFTWWTYSLELSWCTNSFVLFDIILINIIETNFILWRLVSCFLEQEP